MNAKNRTAETPDLPPSGAKTTSAQRQVLRSPFGTGGRSGGSEMKLPAFQFYPADWRKDPGVQSLDYHDRGVWFEMICIMHESDERGKLLLNGRPMPEKALARLLGLDNQSLTTTLTTLLERGVATRDPDTGVIFCRRMVRDESLRKIRQQAGKLGGNPVLVKQNSTTRVNQKPTPSSSSSSSSSERESARSPGFSLNGSEAHIPSLEEIVAYGNGSPGIPKSYCAHYHAKCSEQNRWLVGPPGRETVRGWKSEIVRWWTKDRATWDESKAEPRAQPKKKTTEEYLAEGKVPPECLD